MRSQTKKLREAKDSHDALSNAGFYLPRFCSKQKHWYKNVTQKNIEVLHKDQVTELTPLPHFINAKIVQSEFSKVPELKRYFSPLPAGMDQAVYIHSLANAFTSGSMQALETAMQENLDRLRKVHSESVKKELEGIMPQPFHMSQIELIRAYQARKGVSVENQIGLNRESFQKLSMLFDTAKNDAERTKAAKIICRPIYNCCVTPDYDFDVDPETLTVTVQVTYMSHTSWQPSRHISPRFERFLPDEYKESRNSETVMGKNHFTMTIKIEPDLAYLQVPNLTCTIPEDSVEEEGYDSEDGDGDVRMREREPTELERLLQQAQEEARERRAEVERVNNLMRAQQRQSQETINRQAQIIDQMERDQLNAANLGQQDEVNEADLIQVGFEAISFINDLDFLFTRHGRIYQCTYQLTKHFVRDIAVLKCGHIANKDWAIIARQQYRNAENANNLPNDENDPQTMCNVCRSWQLFRTADQIYKSMCDLEQPFGDDSLIRAEIDRPILTVEEASKERVNRQTLFDAVCCKGDVDMVKLLWDVEDFRPYFALYFRQNEDTQNYWRNQMGEQNVQTVLDENP